MPAFLLIIALCATVGNIRVKADCIKPLDLAFVIDGASSVCNSSSACTNWDFYRQFIHKIVDSLIIGPNDTRVALVVFSDTAHIDWDLNKRDTEKTSLLSAVDQLVYPTGGRNTAEALRLLFSDVFASSADDTSTEVILITDGFPTVENAKMTEAIFDLQNADIITYVIGVTKETRVKRLAKAISSPPHERNTNYFIVDDYSAIDLVREELVKQICTE